MSNRFHSRVLAPVGVGLLLFVAAYGSALAFPGNPGRLAYPGNPGRLSSSTSSAFAQASPTAPLVSVDQARDAFSRMGFQAGEPTGWNWGWAPVTTFPVIDQARGRVLMVFVFPSQSVADSWRQMAEAHDTGTRVSDLTDVASGPHLVEHYGPSIWNGNVAMVQASAVELARAAQASVDRDMGLESAAPSMTDVLVDLDFQRAEASIVVGI